MSNARCPVLTAPMLVLALSMLHPAQRPDVAAAVEGLQRRYAAVRVISGGFTQTYRAPGMEQRESGVFWLKKPGLMRWEYRRPETKLFVADGRETYLYTPGDGQVLIRRFTSEELLNTPLRFLFGYGNIRQAFDVEAESESRPVTPASVLVRLVPRAAESDYLFLVLEVDAATFELRRLIVRERTGNASEFLFHDLVMNPKVDSKLFRFTVPKGVEVIRQNGN